jgi:hypothetical protein
MVTDYKQMCILCVEQFLYVDIDRYGDCLKHWKLILTLLELVGVEVMYEIDQ